jgi:tetratricopeptide (TPR) repeat protein
MILRLCSVIFCCTVILLGCNVNDSTTPKTAQEFIDEGWTQYTQHNYRAALDQFNQAITTDGSVADAYNGAGWSEARLDQLSGAVSSFTTGLEKNSTDAEIMAGLAWTYNAEKNYGQSEAMATAVLAADSAFVFSRDNSLTSVDLHFLLAEDYFADGMYSLSLAQVLLLNPGFPSTLDFSSVSGRISLAAEIERLRGVI